MKCTILTLLLVAGVSATAQERESGIIAPGAEVTLLADGFSFTEGPAADSLGNIYFTDQPNDRILKWSTDGELSVFLSPSGRANGLYFDLNGDLLAAADGENVLWSIAPDGSHKVVAKGFGGKLFNGPNDLWVNPVSGNIYFTDPLYARPYWTHRTAEIQQDGEYVYLIHHSRRAVSHVADDLVKPNGIIGTPDGKTLYVADIGAGKTYAYDIARSGKLKRKRLFAPMGSDGMTIDERGNVYLTGHGVTVFNPAGEQIEHIEVPAGWTANVTFGGHDRRTLFITASEGLFSLGMNVKGVN